MKPIHSGALCRRKGTFMIHLFNPENKFWAFVAKLADVFLLSLLWLVTSLPIVTIGAATAAFYHFTIHQATDTESTVWHGYFSAFKAHFKTSTLIWLIQLAGSLFLGMDAWLAWQYFTFTDGAVGAVIVLGVVSCVTLLFEISFLYAYPIQAIFDFPLKKVLSNCFIMAVGNLPSTLTILLLFAAAAVGIYFISGLFFYWLGLAAFFASYFFLGVFKKYTGEREEELQARAEKRRRKKQEMY
jgi:uncharacterized membrane protein YesL